MSSAQVDILMATYNGEKYLVDQIESIRRQSFDNWRLLISDDGSSDGTLDIIRSYTGLDQRIVDVTPASKPHSAAKNFMRLLAMSSAPYVMFCDQDDVWINDKIEKSIERIRVMQECVSLETPCLVYTDSEVVDERLNPLSSSFVSGLCFDPNSISISQICVENVAQGCTMLLNRALVNLVCSLPMPEQFSFHDHWVMAVCMCRQGGVGYLDSPTMKYRQHADNVVGASGEIRLIDKVCSFAHAVFGVRQWIAAAVQRETKFCNRADALLQTVPDIPESTVEELAALQAFRQLTIIKRLKLIFDRRLLRDRGLYSKIAQVIGLLLA